MRIAYSSIKAFKSKASLLASLLKIEKRRESLEVLARVSGYTSFHEVSHSDVTGGGVPRADEVAAQILQVCSGLTAERASEVADALALHLGPLELRGSGPKEEGQRAESAPLWAIGAPPAVTPGEVGNFAGENRYEEGGGFGEGSFAGHFKLTGYEARAILDTYASEGLVTYAGDRDGQARWLISREGATVFRMRKWDGETAQWTKAAIAAITEKLIQFAQTPGVEEVSIAGRPVFGGGRGTLVVGVRVGDEPYGVPEHRTLLERVLKMRDPKVPLSVLIFKESVPERLQRRMVIHEGALRERTAASHEIDKEEQAHKAALLRIAPERYKEDDWPFDADLQGWGFVSELDRYIGREMALYRLPIACHGAARPLNDITELLADIGTMFDYEFALEKRRRSLSRSWRNAIDDNRVDQAISRAEFALLSLPFSKFYKSLDPTDLLAMGFEGYLSSEGSSEAVVAMIVCRWEKLAKLRASKAAQKERAKNAKAEPAVDYMAAFDCLNFPEPLFVGFVRQPAAHRANLDRLEQHWGRVLAKLPDSDNRIAGALRKNRFHAGGLSIFYRPATKDEVNFFDQASKKANATLAYILPSLEETWMGVPVRNRWDHVDVVASIDIAKPQYREPIVPKLLVDDQAYEGHARLFQVIDDLPIQQRLLARKRFLDARTVNMMEFVAANMMSPRPGLVLAAGLENWKFELLESGWTGTLSGLNWAVVLREKDEVLTIAFRVDEGRHDQQLAPLPEVHDLSFMKPYSGILSQLLVFMQRLETLPTTAAITPNSEHPDKSPIELLVRTADYFLHGRLFDLVFRDGTMWPEISMSGVA